MVRSSRCPDREATRFSRLGLSYFSGETSGGRRCPIKKRARRSFTPEFKLEAVRSRGATVEPGRPRDAAAAELLRGWKNQLEAGGRIARLQRALSVEEENRRLKREVEVPRMERDSARIAPRSSRKTCAALRDARPAPCRVFAAPDVPGPGRQPRRVLRPAAARAHCPPAGGHTAAGRDRRLPPP
jgi:transposase-like protein